MAKDKPKFYGTAQKGKVILHNPEAWAGYIAQFEDGKELELTVSGRYKRRTQGAPGEETNFNGYYWGIIIKGIADEVGEIGEEGYQRIHLWVQMNIGNFKGMPDGKVVPSGTRYKNGGEFAEMCSRARIWAAIPKEQGGLGIYLPEPYETEYQL